MHRIFNATALEELEGCMPQALRQAGFSAQLDRAPGSNRLALVQGYFPFSLHKTLSPQVSATVTLAPRDVRLHVTVGPDSTPALAAQCASLDEAASAYVEWLARAEDSAYRFLAGLDIDRARLEAAGLGADLPVRTSLYAKLADDAGTPVRADFDLSGVGGAVARVTVSPVERVASFGIVGRAVPVVGKPAIASLPFADIADLDAWCWSYLATVHLDPTELLPVEDARLVVAAMERAS